MRTQRAVFLFAVLLAGASFGILVVGPFPKLAALDEALFPAPASANRGGLLFGTDAGTAYVSNGTAWNPVASGTTQSIYGADYPTYRCVYGPLSGSVMVNAGAGNFIDTGTTIAGQTRTDSTVLTQSPRAQWATGVATANQVVGGRIGIRPTGGSAVFGTTMPNLGLFVWSRWYSIPVGQSTSYFAGLRLTTDGGVESEDGGTQRCTPSTAYNVLYMGCDPGEANMSICSNDSTGTATCTNLGANFPCTAGTQFSDVTFTFPDGGASASYYVKNWLTGATATGNITSDLPDPFIPLLWDFRGCNGPDGGIPTIGVAALCWGQQ